MANPLKGIKYITYYKNRCTFKTQEWGKAQKHHTLVCPWGCPFNSKYEIVVTIPIEFGDSSLRIFPVDKVNKPKAPAHAGLLINGNINSAHRTKRTEQLQQIRLSCVFREVGYPHRVLIVPPPHIRSTTPLSPCPHTRRHVGSLGCTTCCCCSI